MTTNNKLLSHIGLFALFLGLCYIILAELIVFYIGETLATISVVKTTGFVILGIIMGIIYRDDARKMIWWIFGAILWPIHQPNVPIESWILLLWSIWLGVISILLLIQGMSIGQEIISNREKKMSKVDES